MQGESYTKRNAARKQAASVEQAHIHASLKKKLARVAAMKAANAKAVQDNAAEAAATAAQEQAASHYRAVAQPSTSVLHRPDMDSKVSLRMLPLMPGRTPSKVVSCHDMLYVEDAHR